MVRYEVVTEIPRDNSKGLVILKILTHLSKSLFLISIHSVSMYHRKTMRQGVKGTAYRFESLFACMHIVNIY